MPRTDKDKRFRQGFAMGLRVAYIIVAREDNSQKQSLKDIESHHDELAENSNDEILRLRDFPGMKDHWKKWNKHVRKQAGKDSKSKPPQDI